MFDENIKNKVKKNKNENKIFETCLKKYGGFLT